MFSLNSRTVVSCGSKAILRDQRRGKSRREEVIETEEERDSLNRLIHVYGMKIEAVSSWEVR